MRRKGKNRYHAMRKKHMTTRKTEKGGGAVSQSRKVSHNEMRERERARERESKSCGY